jgi:periplasmic divalent cation tolerance protein
MLRMTDKRIVFSTAGSKEEASKIAHALVERKLAACVNIVPQVESVYRWKGKVETSQEWLLIVKTTAQNVGAVCSSLKELHSYELPECVAMAVESGSEEYLKWVAESMR